MPVYDADKREWIPHDEKEKSSRIKFKRIIPHSVHIEPSANGGYILRAGCCTNVYTSYRKMLDDLCEYLSDPEGTIKRYNEDLDVPDGPPEQPEAAISERDAVRILRDRYGEEDCNERPE